MQVTSFGLKLQSFMGTLPKNRKLQLAERSLHTQQQSIVDQARIVYVILISQQAPDQRTKFKQCVPVSAVPSQPGCFDGKDRPRVAGADRDEQALKALSCDTAAGATKVVINDNDLLPSKHLSALFQGVLTTAALWVVE
jgi:hypothetical protein